MIQNLDRAWKVWWRMSRILRREGARPWFSGFFFKSVDRSVLLLGTEMWVVTTRMGRLLGNFQDQVVRQPSVRISRRRMDRRYEYTSSEAAREEARFGPTETYICRRQNTVAQYIAT